MVLSELSIVAPYSVELELDLPLAELELDPAFGRTGARPYVCCVIMRMPPSLLVKQGKGKHHFPAERYQLVNRMRAMRPAEDKPTEKTAVFNANQQQAAIADR